jgi:hypothetical protein
MLPMPVTSYTTTMHLLTQLIVTPSSRGLMLIVIVDPMHIGIRLTLITEKVAMNMGIEENLTLQPLKFMYFLGIRVT